MIDGSVNLYNTLLVTKNKMKNKKTAQETSTTTTLGPLFVFLVIVRCCVRPLPFLSCRGGSDGHGCDTAAVSSGKKKAAPWASGPPRICERERVVMRRN